MYSDKNDKDTTPSLPHFTIFLLFLDTSYIQHIITSVENKAIL